jgi:hypothetical protein
MRRVPSTRQPRGRLKKQVRQFRSTDRFLPTTQQRQPGCRGGSMSSGEQPLMMAPIRGDKVCISCYGLGFGTIGLARMRHVYRFILREVQGDAAAARPMFQRYLAGELPEELLSLARRCAEENQGRASISHVGGASKRSLERPNATHNAALVARSGPRTELSSSPAVCSADAAGSNRRSAPCTGSSISSV